MSVIDFNKEKVIKALKDNGNIKSKNQVEFYNVPDELNELGVNEIITTDGKELTDEDLQAIIKLAKKFKNKGTSKS